VALDIDRLRKERVYSGSDTVPGVMADIVRLGRFDAESQKRRGEWMNLALMTGMAGALGLVGGLVVAGGAQGTSLFSNVCVLLGVLLLMGAMLCLGMAQARQALDLEDRRYQLVSRLLQKLRKDIAPDERVTLELGFHPTDIERNVMDRGSAGEWLTRSYVNRWLSLQVRLADGTHLRLAMEQRLQKWERTRRNPRGKWKTKRKQKGAAALIDVRLRVKPERHPRLAQLERQARAAVRLPPGASLARLTVKEDGLSLRARMDLDWDEEDASRAVLMMLLSLYQVLNYSHALRKRDVSKAFA
jgi:hypothetical protein